MDRIIEASKKKLESFGCKVNDEDIEALEEIKNSTDEYIKSFCGISQIPEGLFYARRDVICGEFLLEKRSTGSLDIKNMSIEKEVKSIQEGDVTVVYSDDSLNKEKKVDAFIEHLIYRLGKEILNYRCVKWN